MPKQEISQSKSIFFLVASILMAVLVIYVGALAVKTSKSIHFVGKAPDIQNTFTVEGQGKIKSIPDVMRITLGVMTESRMVSVAQEDNTKKMNALMDALKQFGIQEKDIKTVNYFVSPQYDWFDGRQSLRGYQVNSEVEVTIRDFDKSSAVLQKVGELELNQVYGLRFEIDDPKELREQARMQAIQEAQEKAKILSRTLGIRLGDVVGYYEFEGGQPPYYPMYERGASAGGFGGGPSVAPGEQEVSVHVNLTYKID